MTDRALHERIRERFGDDAVAGALMSERTNFRVGGPADLLVAPRTVEGLQDLMRMIGDTAEPVFILGGGSNLVVRDGGFRGIVIDMSRGFDGFEFLEAGGDGSVVIRAGASRTVEQVVESCVERALAGMEWAAGIPGTVGGGIRGNAGTRDGDFATVLKSVALVDDKGALRRMPRSELDFRYRGMGLVGRFVIVEGEIEVRSGDRAAVAKKVRSMIDWRRTRQPYESACAGSIFKNPPQAPAGRLIDQAGLKGARIGGAQVSEMHTNFIVNDRSGSAADILAVIDLVRRRVKEVHGVDLDLEVIIVGEDHVGA